MKLLPIKILFCLVSLIGLALSAEAQNCTLSGIITDKSTGEPLQGVIITCDINGKTYHTATDSLGSYILVLKRGSNTTLKVSLTGYKSTTRAINCSNENEKKDIEMEVNSVVLDSLVVKAYSGPTTRGDTIVYRIDRSKINRDETAEDMLKKGVLAGIGTKDGKLMAHGEEVKEVLINGKEFFKDDITTALRNLPANVISEIRVFDKKSDYAELTGFDDGNTLKAINLIINEKNTFGKFYAGGGLDERYKFYGMINSIKNDRSYSVFSQLNNINEQNFSMLDLLSATGTASSSAPSQSPYSKNSVDNSFHPTASDDVSSMLVDVSESGITTSRAAGVNYSDSLASGKMFFTGHYLFNSSTNDTEYDITDQYFGENTSDNLQNQVVNTDNINHRFNSKFNYTITDKDYLMLRPSLTYQKKNENSKLTDWTRDSVETDLLLNQTTKTDQNVIGVSSELMYKHDFNDSRGKFVSFDARFSYMKTSENIDMTFENVQAEQNAIQQTHSYNIQKTYTFMASYAHPLTRRSKLKADFGWNMTYGIIKRKTELMADDATEFTLDSLLCGTTRSDYGGLIGILSYMYNNGGLNLISGLESHVYNFKSKNDITNSFHYSNALLPYLILRYRFGLGNQFHLEYRTSQRFPGLLQMQDAINNANASMAVRGNIELEAAYHHNLSFRLVMPNQRKGTITILFANLEQADNYIGSRRSLSSSSYTDDGDKRNSEMYSYKNADGYFSISSLIAHGFPVSFNVKDSTLLFNFNISTLFQHSKIPGFWDNEKTFTKTISWSSFITFASNISKEINFVLDFNCKYNQSRNQRYDEHKVHYWSLSYGGQLNWEIIPSLKIVLECGRTNYFGSNTSKFNALISNAAIAYKFLRQKRGELRLSCNDIFNKNNNFYEITNEIYRREVVTSVLKRHVLLTFTYNLNL